MKKGLIALGVIIVLAILILKFVPMPYVYDVTFDYESKLVVQKTSQEGEHLVLEPVRDVRTATATFNFFNFQYLFSGIESDSSVTYTEENEMSRYGEKSFGFRGAKVPLYVFPEYPSQIFGKPRLVVESYQENESLVVNKTGFKLYGKFKVIILAPDILRGPMKVNFCLVPDTHKLLCIENFRR